jgi:hypothetical protein
MFMTPDTIKEIEQLITTIGFPIVCVIFMWRKITESDEKQTALLTELTLAIKNLTDYIKDRGVK